MISRSLMALPLAHPTSDVYVYAHTHALTTPPQPTWRQSRTVTLAQLPHDILPKQSCLLLRYKETNQVVKKKAY